VATEARRVVNLDGDRDARAQYGHAARAFAFHAAEFVEPRGYARQAVYPPPRDSADGSGSDFGAPVAPAQKPRNTVGRCETDAPDVSVRASCVAHTRRLTLTMPARST
jgi:hypothetical protein